MLPTSNIVPSLPIDLPAAPPAAVAGDKPDTAPFAQLLQRAQGEPDAAGDARPERAARGEPGPRETARAGAERKTHAGAGGARDGARAKARPTDDAAGTDAAEGSDPAAAPRGEHPLLAAGDAGTPAAGDAAVRAPADTPVDGTAIATLPAAPAATITPGPAPGTPSPAPAGGAETAALPVHGNMRLAGRRAEPAHRHDIDASAPPLPPRGEVGEAAEDATATPRAAPTLAASADSVSRDPTAAPGAGPARGPTWPEPLAASAAGGASVAAVPARESSAASGHTLAEARLSAAPDAPGFAPELGAQVALWVAEGKQEARLQLHPAELGPVTVQIALQGNAAQVDFTAAVAATRASIEQSLPALAAALRESGFTLAGGGVSDGSGQGAAADARGHGGQAGHGHAPRGMAAIGSADTAGHSAAVPRRWSRSLVDVYA